MCGYSPRMTTRYIDGTEALPYKPPQLSDIPFRDGGNASRAAVMVWESRRAWPGIILALLREESREADLSTEQAGAQAPSWLPDPDGNSGRSQGAQCAARAWPEGAQCVTARPHPALGPRASRPPLSVGKKERARRPRSRGRVGVAGRRNGTTEATQRFSGGRRRRERFDARICRAGTPSRGRWAGSGRVHGVTEGGRRGRAQSRAPAIAGSRAAFRRH